MGRPRRERVDDQRFRAAVARSRSIAAVIRELGEHVSGTFYRAVKRRITELGIDTSHFAGRSWRRGASKPVVPAAPLDQILIRNSTYTSIHRLKPRLIAAGVVEERCYGCGLTEWRGRPISLQLEHRNGDSHDHRRENLELLCPNCHSQTSTFAGRNKALRRAGDADA